MQEIETVGIGYCISYLQRYLEMGCPALSVARILQWNQSPVRVGTGRYLSRGTE